MSISNMLLTATNLVYFLALGSCFTTQSNNIYSSFDKSRIKKNALHNSVSVRNGQIFVNWSTIGPWNTSKQVNMTVYFLSNYIQNGNIYGINISTCFASKYKRNSWVINPLKGNLLKFCKQSSKCGPFNDDIVVLTNSSWMPEDKQLSCQLFTTCSNFDGVFGIEIVVNADNKQYKYFPGNLTISSQHVPPSPTHIQLSDDGNGILWDYPNSTQLCGFGPNGSTKIKFLIEIYMSNQCKFMGKRTVDFHERSATFNNLANGHKYIYYLSAISTMNNQTSWLKLVADKTSQRGSRCFVHGGMLSFSWYPEWNCHGKDVVNQAFFVHGINAPPVLVCQATLFKNGTITVASFSKNLIGFCNDYSSFCRLDSNNTDMVDVTWDSSSGKINCNIFKQCVTYQNRFTIKMVQLDAITNERIDSDDFCDIVLLNDNHPPAPTNLRIVSIQQTSITFAWDFQQCETLFSSTEIKICYKSSDDRSCFVVEMPMSYMYTLSNLSYFTKYQIQVSTRNEFQQSYKSTTTPYVKSQTKEGAPLSAPTITHTGQEKHGVKLSWKNQGVLQGIPRLVVIEVLDDKKNIFHNETLNGTNINSTIINLDELKKCDSLVFFKVKICNSPNLCSPFTDPQKYKHLCRTKDSSSSHNWTKNKLFFTFIILVSIAVLLFVLLCYARKQRRKKRTLPNPELPIECETDYIGIGQISQPNEYNCFDIQDKEALVVN